MVGVVIVPLNFLAHGLDFQGETLTVIDYKARQAGFLKIDVVPCNLLGSEEVDKCVNDPIDLVIITSYVKQCHYIQIGPTYLFKIVLGK